MMYVWAVVCVVVITVQVYVIYMRRSFVEPLTDDEAIKLMSGRTIWVAGRVEMAFIVARWRRYAASVGYEGPVVWRVKAGFTLKNHASYAGLCRSGLKYLQSWNLKNDEPTKDRIVFWVPRLAVGSTGKTITQMEALRRELWIRHELPAISFGSIALLLALILKHYQLTGEKAPAPGSYATSDTTAVRGRNSRLMVGYSADSGLFCGRSDPSVVGENIGFFLLYVAEIDPPLTTPVGGRNG